MIVLVFVWIVLYKKVCNWDCSTLASIWYTIVFYLIKQTNGLCVDLALDS